jgi:hypothetical protein
VVEGEFALRNQSFQGILHRLDKEERGRIYTKDEGVFGCTNSP